MKLRSHRLLNAVALLVLLPALACARDDASETDADTPPATEAVTSELRVTDVQVGSALGADRRVTAAREQFAAADTIYASVATDGTASGATLTARWTFEDGQVVDETSQTLSPSGPAVTEFHISRPGGFPTGEYRVEILLNGASVQSREFEVR